MKKHVIRLKDDERNLLKQLLHKGTEKSRKLTRARILLLAEEGRSDPEISKALDIAASTAYNIRRRYTSGGLTLALNERPRPGQPEKFTGEQRAKITVLACTTPPEGRKRWTMRLLRDKAVELDIVDNICYKSVETILKKTN